MPIEHGIFEYEYWDEIDVLVYNFQNVTFHQDFGVFKTGTHAESIVLDYSKLRMVEHDDEGNELRVAEFKLVPVS